MKRKSLCWLCAIVTSLPFFSCSNEMDGNPDNGSGPGQFNLEREANAQVIFEDNFDQTDGIPDTTKWVLCPQQSPAWARYLSESYDQAYVQDGKLVLVGEIVNGQYKTGGVQTLGKAEFTYGKVEVCARFTKSAQGGWPAIWMMPSAPIYPGWPDCGEIDIMEQLNHDNIVYQTIHNYYKNTLGHYDPNPSITAPYNQNEFNVYAVDWTEDALIFSINGVTKLTYPNLRLADENVKRQWPFAAPFYIILNQALGGPGTWPGAITDAELPAKMEVDWVKVTQYN